MKNLTPEVINNRQMFLSELRSGKHKKGTIRSDEKGNPIVEGEKDEGCCACALMVTLFFNDGEKPSEYNYRKSLNLNAGECRFIQSQINDTPLNFQEIADRIENEVFNLLKTAFKHT